MSMLSYEELNLQPEVSQTNASTQELYRQFYSFFPANTRTVLDLGCVTGRGDQVLKSLNNKLKISGLDCATERLERLPKEVYDQSIYSLSTHIFCDDRTFDVVVAGKLIEHIYPIDVDRTLTEIFRVLKVGGRLLLTAQNPLDIKKRVFQESVLDNETHVSQHFHDVLSLKLKMMGFTSVRVYGIGNVTRYLGYYFPWLHAYGSYLVIADKR